MTNEKYKAERKLRGTQTEVAAQLGVRQATVSDRENGGEITREAWLALNALPKKRPTAQDKHVSRQRCAAEICAQNAGQNAQKILGIGKEKHEYTENC